MRKVRALALGEDSSLCALHSMLRLSHGLQTSECPLNWGHLVICLEQPAKLPAEKHLDS